MTSKPLPKTFEEFMAESGLDGTPDVQSHIHAGLRCAPDTKTYRRWYKSELDRLQRKRDAMRDEARLLYDAALKSGMVRQPTRVEVLMKTAQGHSDNLSVRAARSVL